MTQLTKSSSAIGSSFLSADWDFQNADTAYLTHGSHRYSGKFIPQVAGQAIELLTNPGDLVVDPYCGSGTTLVEAGLRGRAAIGIDMNPLAVLIASVKTTPVDTSALHQFTQNARACVDRLEESGLFKAAMLDRDANDWRLTDPWFTKWFQPTVLQDLVVIYNRIFDEPNDLIRKIGLTALSDILRRSSNAHQGYPNVMFDKKGGARPRPGRSFLKALLQLTNAVAQLSDNGAWDHVRVEQGDARELPLDDGIADAVITHPPYVGSIPYAEYGALSLKWLGHDPKALDRNLTGGQRQSKHVLTRFIDDYGAMIREAYRVTKSGGYLFVLVGNPTIKGVIADLTNMTLQHSESAGYCEIVKKARSAQNRRANKMGDETLLVFRKNT